MALKNLDNRERDLQLENRRRPPVVEPAPAAPRPAGDAEMVGEIRRRARAARRLKPPEQAPCRDCWSKGRDAAAEAVLAAADGAVIDVVDSGRRLEPSGPGPHWRECWDRGRDAALSFIEGEGEIEE